MADPFSLVLLGIPHVQSNNQSVRGFKSRKTLALLCYLAVRAQPLTRTHLANLFWGDKSEADGRANLSRALNNLTTLFPNSIRATRDTLNLVDDVFTVDIRTFETLSTRGSVEALHAAVALYHDEFMSGLFLDDCPEFEVWLAAERERWRQQIVSALERLGEHHVRRGEPGLALPIAARLLEIEPWREETHRLMMQLLADTGQRSAALQQFETARRVLATELGVEPAAETTALYEKIRAGSDSSNRPRPPRTNLPRQLTSFVGRETELARVSARLNNPECRLLTLVGIGGIGKTRLALEAGKNAARSFRDGVCFVPLAPIGAGQIELVAPAIASALEMSSAERQNPQTQLLAFLRDKQLLLVLDNFEHLVTASEFVLEILRETSEVKILVTSREPLDVQAEWVTRLAGLTYPTGAVKNEQELLHYNAVQLFIERARRGDERAGSDAESIAFAGRLARLVEGLPLALELAAARTRTFSVKEICEQVERNFDVLETSMRDVTPRHRSLRAVLDWSYALLPPSEQDLFCRVSVFAGGWTRQAAGQVAGMATADRASVDSQRAHHNTLENLVAKSLAIRQEIENETRYRLLEPVREYAHEKLRQAGAADTTDARHLNFFLELAEQAEPALVGAQQGAWLRRLEQDVDNLRAALTWGLAKARDHAAGIRLAGALWRFWYMRGYFQEGASRLETAIQIYPTAPHALVGKVMTGAGYMAWCQGDYARAKEFHAQALTMYRAAADAAGIAFAIHNLGGVAFYLGERQKAEELFAQSLELAASANDVWLTAVALISLGEAARYREDYERARTLQEQGLDAASKSGDQQLIALALSNLGHIATAQADYARAVRVYQQSLVAFHQAGERRLVAEELEGFAEVLAAQSKLDVAARLLAAAQALREEISYPLPSVDRTDYERKLGVVQSGLDKSTFERAWTEGRELTMEQAIAYALEASGAPDVMNPSFS